MRQWPLSRITRWCAIMFLIGVAANEYFMWSWLWLSVVVWISIILIASRKHKILIVLGCCVLSFGIGMTRGQVGIPSVTPHDISVFNDTGSRDWEGVIVKEPDIRETRQKLTVRVSDYRQGDVNYHGLMLVEAPSYPWFEYGDKVSMRCGVEEPFVTQEFSYKDYLARHGIFSWCRTPAYITIVSRDNGLWALSSVYTAKRWLIDSMNAVLPEPHSTLLTGILFGARSAFPKGIAQDFSTVGLTHIVAISGYNITLVIVAMATIIRGVGLGRKRATWVTLFGVAVFTIFTGASSATLRAAIMGSIILIAGHMGRTQMVGHTLIIVALCMVMISPTILLHDAGFQLSFLATMGLVYGSPIIAWATSTIPLLPSWLKEVIDQTLSATIATAPLIVVEFSSLSLISLLANILVLPTIALVMVLGMLIVVATTMAVFMGSFVGVWHMVVSPLFWFTWLALEYIIVVARYLGSVPHAAITIAMNEWGWVFFVLTYGTMFLVISTYHRIHHTDRETLNRDARSTVFT